MKKIVPILICLALSSCSTLVKTTSTAAEDVWQYVEFDSVEAVNQYLAEYPYVVRKWENYEFSSGATSSDVKFSDRNAEPVITPVSRGDKIAYVLRVLRRNDVVQSIKLSNGDIVRASGNEPVVVLFYNHSKSQFFVKVLMDGGKSLQTNVVGPYKDFHTVNAIGDFVMMEYHTRVLYLDPSVGCIPELRGKEVIELEL